MPLLYGLSLLGGSTFFVTGLTGFLFAAIPDIATVSAWVATAASGASIIILSIGGAWLKFRKDMREDQRKWEVQQRDDQRKWEDSNKETLAALLIVSERENLECQTDRQIMKEELDLIKSEFREYRKDYLDLSKIVVANRGGLAEIEFRERGVGL